MMSDVIIEKVIKQSIANKQPNSRIKCQSNMKYLLNCINISLDDINKLNIIHVAGSKGKGSTCSFIESILRQYGYKTGLFTSPHLINYNERIKINNKNIAMESFNKHTHNIYEAIQLYHQKHNKNEVIYPNFFQFLTLVGFSIFIEEKVDVLILEVGLGGRLDATNVVTPICCGISLIDYDHQEYLGDTLELIAGEKAGIMKCNVPCYTIKQQQKDSVINVLKNAAIEYKTNLYIVESILCNDNNNNSISLGIAGKHQYINAALALALCEYWLLIKSNQHIQFPTIKNNNEIIINFDHSQYFSNHITKALLNCQWNGRCQKIQFSSDIILLLDCAHTPKSMFACSEWINTQLQNYKEYTTSLLFNCAPNRNPINLLNILKLIKFHEFNVCPFDNDRPRKNILKQYKDFLPELKEIEELSKSNVNMNELTWQHTLIKIWYHLTKGKAVGNYHTSVNDALMYMLKPKSVIVVTGSVYLVGNVLNFIRQKQQLDE